MSRKRQAIDFTGNFGKKLKIEEEEKPKELHFGFGNEQIKEAQSDTVQSLSKVSDHWQRKDSTKSTTDWGKLVENAFLDQILDDIKQVESEREDKKNC